MTTCSKTVWAEKENPLVKWWHCELCQRVSQINLIMKVGLKINFLKAKLWIMNVTLVTKESVEYTWFKTKH